MEAFRIAAAVGAGELSPVDVVREALAAAESWQPVTNAFSQLRPEDSVAEARALADRLAGGEAAGPLAGVPVAIKDLFDVEGWETTGCCAAFRGRVAERDAGAVQRLRAAGAVVIGKTNQHELAAGATNVVSACGPTRNPWDADRITGGSSGGSAAAVAAGVAPLALGSDTGGSIRIPSSFCGAWGLKPTYGSVPMDGAMPLSPSLDTGGPMATGVEDLRLAFEVLAGRRLERGSTTGRSVAVLHGPSVRTAREDVLASVDRVAEVLAAAGARVTTRDVAGIEDALEVWDRVAWTELAEAYPDLVDSEDVHERTRGILAFGARSRGEASSARARMGEIRAVFLDALADADALLLATTPTSAPRLGDRIVSVGGAGLDVRTGAPSVLTRPVSLTGLPAVSIPVGLSEEGMPIGVQLVGRPDGEGVLLDACEAVQASVEVLRPPAPEKL